MKIIPEERKKLISDFVYRNKVCSLSYLASKLGVSKITIQKDINSLAENGLVLKVQGGIKLKEKDDITIVTRFSTRLNQNHEQKSEIAKKALKLIKDETTIFLDHSTTCYIFALEIFKKNFLDLNIITNSPAILTEALRCSYPGVIITGGLLTQNNHMLCGDYVIDFLEKINIDMFFLSAGGVSLTNGITTNDYEISNILGRIIKNHNEIILLVDSSKFSKSCMLEIASVKRCKKIITDKAIDKETVSDFKKNTEIEFIF